MASSARAARLARLSKLVQPDLAALPDRTLTPPPEQETVSDDNTPGGISLFTPSSKPATPAVSPTVESFEADTAPAPASEGNIERRFVWEKGAESTYNLGSMPRLVPLPTSKLPPIDLKQSECATVKFFSPFVALSKYPYKFCDNKYTQDIASAFFDAGKFWTRQWDLYYVWDIEETKPLILVSEPQFQELVDEINAGLNLSLQITNNQREEGLVGRFPDHPRFQPRYLGRSHSKDEYNSLVDNVPNIMVRPANEPALPALDDNQLQVFKQMIEDMWEVTRNKNKATKEKKRLERIQKQKVFADSFKRAQRYLGLRPAALVGIPGQTPALSAIDNSVPVPFPFEKSVVFVCVDVESYEKAHDKITEVGIATLDTRDLLGVPPGKDGETWRDKIHARHFRIQEYTHLVNKDFVSGCPERFDFGKSEFVKLADAPAIVAECFRTPFCGPADSPSPEQRTLIFLGHDTLGDVKYLQQLGFDPLVLPNLIESLDTATLYRVWRRELQPTKLANILYDFDIAGFNLHNAGNDAMFTLQAMLGICVREASIRGSAALQDIRDEEKAAKAAVLLSEAKVRAEEEADGWSDHEADGDGGEPVPIVIKDTPPSPFPKPSPVQGGGRGGRGGRGRGDYTNTNGRGSSRGEGRGRGVPRARAQGYRGRGRGASSNTPSNDGFPAAGLQVCHDLIDLS
ncbi:hypothetical protein P280DRAFT_469392 [Massarina eburnea CBS 473.64]|uniref:Gfd2/YDR514C-like C-terminal domain-containing protein n=1 Tax=Massarina eburnea CBS 473.64 TaxID=1395130 RepID=A0A6A6S2R3_9PLEO|nr:hypothetical protein P280DRAFT_469392 [Massarina eburnea CBS 473.64]